MKKIIILLAIIIACVSVYGADVLYTDFSKPVPYNISFGDEAPNTEPDVVRVNSEGIDNSACIKVDYKFHKTGKYWTYNLNLGKITADGFSFMAKGPQGENLLIRFTDNSGETFQTNFNIANNDWNKYTISFADNFGHWGGNNNGKFDFPIKYVCIGISKATKDEGILYIDNVSFSGNEKKIKKDINNMNMDKLKFYLDSGKIGNLFYYEDELVAKLVPNVPITNASGTLKLEFFDGFGKPIKTNIKEFKYSSEKDNIITLPNIKGYCEVKYSGKINNQKKEGSFSFAVIPNNSQLCGKKESNFGVCIHVLSPETARLVKRSGISWIRDCDYAPFTYKTVEICRRYDIRLMALLPFYTKSQAFLREEFKKGKTANDKFDFTSSIDDYAKFAKECGDFVDMYDICNEPNNTGWCEFGGSYWGGPWADIYAQWGTQVAKIIKENDPNEALVVWEDCHHYWAYQWIKNGITNEFDVIAPHPYNIDRNNYTPEEEGFECQNMLLTELMKAKGIKWKMIAGEVGFTSYQLDETTPGSNYHECTTDIQAAWAMRMMIMHLTSGEEKIFYYDMYNDGTDIHNQEANFGLMKNIENPKPIMCAYANLINLCDGAKWTGRQDIQGSRLYGFITRDGVQCGALWKPTGKETLSVNTNSITVKKMDMFGNTETLVPQNGKITLESGEHPVYLIGI